MRCYLIAVLAIFSLHAYAGQEYCVPKIPVYEEKLTAKEICKYSNSCLDVPKNEKMTMYCDMPNLSECFENRQWLGVHDYLGVPKSTFIEGTSKRYKKEAGKINKTFCGTNSKDS
jgi:hypothetical protein